MPCNITINNRWSCCFLLVHPDETEQNMATETENKDLLHSSLHSAVSMHKQSVTPNALFLWQRKKGLCTVKRKTALN